MQILVKSISEFGKKNGENVSPLRGTTVYRQIIGLVFIIFHIYLVHHKAQVLKHSSFV